MDNTDAAPKIFIVADDLLARAGLAALFADQPGGAVAGQSSEGDDLGTAADAAGADVLVWDLGRDPEDVAARLTAHSRPEPIVVLLPDGTGAADALAAGARGVAPRDASPETIAALERAEGHGLIAINPSSGA